MSFEKISIPYTVMITPMFSKNISGKIFFYQMTGGKKYFLTKEEYKILTNPNDIRMLIFYQYLIYIIYSGISFYSAHHFKYVDHMLKQIENKQKKKILKKNKSSS